VIKSNITKGTILPETGVAADVVVVVVVVGVVGVVGVDTRGVSPTNNIIPF